MTHDFNTDKANQIHDNKYDYHLVVYVNIDTKVTILCPLHGEFQQTPYKHINNGQGCPKCRGNRISHSKRMSVAEFIIKAQNIHGLYYDYSRVEYINAHKKVIIICPHHGEFLQTPNNHLYIKNGCPACGKGRNISLLCTQWLDSLGVSKLDREKVLRINNSLFKVDAFVSETNTIYEYFGIFWHAHPDYLKPGSIHPIIKIPVDIIYQKTLQKIDTITNSSYNFVYIWGR